VDGDKMVLASSDEGAITVGTPRWFAWLEGATTITRDLSCATDEVGGIVTDEFGRTNIKGVYAAGDIVKFM
jgi:thioredoxin reductase